MPPAHSVVSSVRGLYAITPDTPDTERLLALVRSALAGGIDLLQYRNKSPDGALRREQAAALLALCRAHGVPLIVNDDVALACAIDADGAHLGTTDGDLAPARHALGTGKLLGASCYAQIPLALAAIEQGADHVAFGAFFPSPTKGGTARATPALLEAARDQVTVPIVAIGGITADHAGPLLAAGAAALAVVSAVFDAPDVVAAVHRFQTVLGAHRT